MSENRAKETGNGTTSSVSIDPTSALYMHPSENAGSSLIPTVFDGTGYTSWRRGIIKRFICEKQNWFYKWKSVKARPSPEYPLWERCDDMVTSWIVTSFSRDLADSL